MWHKNFGPSSSWLLFLRYWFVEQRNILSHYHTFDMSFGTMQLYQFGFVTLCQKSSGCCQNVSSPDSIIMGQHERNSRIYQHLPRHGFIRKIIPKQHLIKSDPQQTAIDLVTASHSLGFIIIPTMHYSRVRSFFSRAPFGDGLQRHNISYGFQHFFTITLRYLYHTVQCIVHYVLINTEFNIL